MISYCLCLSKYSLASLLLRDLREKTGVPYEILVWMNTDDQKLVDLIETMAAERIPLRVLGSTPSNMGMMGFRILFEHAKYDMVAQVDEHVVYVGKGLPEKAAAVFKKHKDVQMVVSDVLQDRFTDGAKPSMDQYKCIDSGLGLYDGPMDGWYAVYRKSFVPSLFEAPYAPYFYLGSWARGKAISMGGRGLLSDQMKVFNAYGQWYSEYFGNRLLEAEQFKSYGRPELADLYEKATFFPEDIRGMKLRIDEVRMEFSRH
jgi:hypothetical protein